MGGEVCEAEEDAMTRILDAFVRPVLTRFCWRVI